MRTQRIFQPARRFTPSIVCSLPYSVLVILAELDRVALAHKAFTEDALALIVRSSEGILRAAKNLCVASLLEAVRDRVKTAGLKQLRVNVGLIAAARSEGSTLVRLLTNRQLEGLRN